MIKQTITTATSGDNKGKGTFKNITDGYYEVKEVNAPPGYVLPTNTAFYFKVDGGAVTYLKKGSGAPSSWDNNPDNPLITFEVAQAAVEDDTATEEDESKEATNATFVVGNTPGTQLPETGGMGTTLFTALGGLMTVTAGAILTVRRGKRKTAES